MTERMVAYVGWRRETEVAVDVEIIGGIAGKVRCFECHGVPAEVLFFGRA